MSKLYARREIKLSKNLSHKLELLREEAEDLTKKSISINQIIISILEDFFESKSSK